MKIKFDKYMVAVKNRPYCILIPKNIQQLWPNNYGNTHYGTFWDGNRDALNAMIYSCAVLGFDPNKIIYFPVRNNPVGELYMRSDGESDVDPYDMVFLNHHIQFPRCKWKQVKRMMEKQRPQTYIIDYRETRTVQYFQDSIENSSKSGACYKEKRPIEELRGDNLFYVFSKMQFREMYLNIHEFLQEDLEGEIQHWLEQGCLPPSIPSDFCPLYSGHMIEIGYYDRKYDETYRHLRRKALE